MIADYDKRMALSDGYISCSECGHDVRENHELPDGCTMCLCTIIFTDNELRELFKAYEFPPYRLNARVRYHDDLLDTGTVIFIDRDGSVEVHWDGDGVSRVMDPLTELVVL